MGYENETHERGERYVWLAPNVVDHLPARPGPRGSYSDVILRLAKAAISSASRRSRGRDERGETAIKMRYRCRPKRF